VEPEPEPEPPQLAAAPEPEPDPEPEPAATQLQPRRDGYNLHELEHAVAEAGAAQPDRLDEWQSYLFFLRDHADLDGRLPRSFDALIEDVFAGLL
ncbi:MAG: hypothetical protein ACR2MU_01990, partial [Gaiellaceae bacterium]